MSLQERLKERLEFESDLGPQEVDNTMILIMDELQDLRYDEVVSAATDKYSVAEASRVIKRFVGLENNDTND